MGASFSPSDAALEGFEVLKRHWRAAVGWALANLVAWVALSILLVIALIGVAAFAGSGETGGDAGAVVVALLLGVGGGLVELTILCGVFRAELKPDMPSFLHLRLSRDELRVLGAALLLALVAVPLVAADILLGRVVAAQAGLGWGFLAGVVGLLAAYAVLLRLGLTPVIAFAEGRISLPESWRRTRGQTWRLVGMVVLMLVILLLLALLASGMLFVVSGLTTGFSDFDLSGEEAFRAHPGRYLLEIALQLMLTPFWLILGQAPWIAVYRALPPEAGA